MQIREQKMIADLVQQAIKNDNRLNDYICRITLTVNGFNFNVQRNYNFRRSVKWETDAIKMGLDLWKLDGNCRIQNFNLRASKYPVILATGNKIERISVKQARLRFKNHG